MATSPAEVEPPCSPHLWIVFSGCWWSLALPCCGGPYRRCQCTGRRRRPQAPWRSKWLAMWGVFLERLATRRCWLSLDVFGAASCEKEEMCMHVVWRGASLALRAVPLRRARPRYRGDWTPLDRACRVLSPPGTGAHPPSLLTWSDSCSSHLAGGVLRRWWLLPPLSRG